MVNSVASQPTFAVETVGTLLHKLELAGGTFGYVLTVEANEVAIFDAAVRAVAGVAGGAAPFEIALAGDMTRMSGKALVPHDT